MRNVCLCCRRYCFCFGLALVLRAENRILPDVGGSPRFAAFLFIHACAPVDELWEADNRVIPVPKLVRRLLQKKEPGDPTLCGFPNAGNSVPLAVSRHRFGHWTQPASLYSDVGCDGVIICASGASKIDNRSSFEALGSLFKFCFADNRTQAKVQTGRFGV